VRPSANVLPHNSLVTVLVAGLAKTASKGVARGNVRKVELVSTVRVRTTSASHPTIRAGWDVSQRENSAAENLGEAVPQVYTAAVRMVSAAEIKAKNCVVQIAKAGAGAVVPARLAAGLTSAAQVVIPVVIVATVRGAALPTKLVADSNTAARQKTRPDCAIRILRG
jgi:hypothetical protein